ncbi:MAG: FAD-dependent oxidoreductase [Betaproteobacteria bacterium]|nr:MAG: FAD-dependent oxidoreductase [Betaproteobacteria bacterium]
MKSHARVVVIGGGIVGCSILYHLTKLGWKDVVLVERKELTAGSTWHAAGGFHALNSDMNVARLQAYTISVYREVQEISGQDVGMHLTGGLNMAATPERWDYLKAEWARHRVIGLETELVGPEEIRRMCPIVDTTDILGAIYDPKEGHLDPSGATHAYAKSARLAGAEIYRHTRVIELTPTPDGGWQVVTDKGTIRAEHVVNAAGLWAREVGHMVGANLPLIPMEHHYLITEDIPEVVAAKQMLPLALDLDGEIYMRQEGKGVLVGLYEHNAKPWALKGTPWDYGQNDLLPPALDRLTDHLERGFRRFPSVARAGIRRVVNGPFTFTPDGNPLVGPVPGLKNYWSACGVLAGFAQGGGIGLALSQWMVKGEPDGDIFAMDVARFGDYATPGYTTKKACEFYSRRFQMAYPNEIWPAARPTKTTPVYDALRGRNAVFGVSYGLEMPLYYAQEGEPAAETPSLRRSNAFPAVAAECQTVREGAGVLEASPFSKYEISGPGAAAWLDQLLACRLPGPGRIRLAPMLSPTARMMGDLTLMRLSESRFMIFGSGYLQAWHMRWFHEHLPASGVELRNLSEDLFGFALAGPSSRELLTRLVSEDVSNAAFPFMSARDMEVACAPAIVGRLSVSGELGYEIYVPAAYLHPLYSRITAAMEGLAARYFGVYALLSLRLEKSFGIWSREFSRDYTPTMCGMSRFVAYDKPTFIGRDAALRDRDAPPPRKLVTLDIEAVDADASGFEPIWLGGRLIGYTTSGGYGHCIGRSLAMGYVDTRVYDASSPLEVSVVGKRRAARILTEPPYDPAGTRMRT